MSDRGWSEVQPIVLVGGKSRRFGRDKLRERVGAGLLVERPIAALRAVFGARVKVVGECDASVAAAADGVIEDCYPGIGPIGGILSVLETWGGPVCVLAGDMPAVTGAEVEAVMLASKGAPEALAVLAAGTRAHPCAGLYRQGAREFLARAVAAGRYALGDALPRERIATASVPERAMANVNTVEDL